MHFKVLLVAWFLLNSPLLPAAQQGMPFTPKADLVGSWAFTHNPALPDVLIIGDSISIAYTRQVRELFQGRANVHRPMSADGFKPANCGDTRMGLAGLDAWLAGRQWRVIHFNWGLWDLCYRNPSSETYGNRDKINGNLSVPLDEYGRNLEQLVVRLKKTGAILVWASTTVVPEAEPGRFAGDEIKYNHVAAMIMVRHNVLVDDLHALTAALPHEDFRAPADVHYTDKGSAKLARQVATQIDRALAQPLSTSKP
jgi:hypothetical protein